MKSPCLECELLNEDKNNPTCTACTKRILYDKGLGPPTTSLSENITMDGEAGLHKNIEELEEIIEDQSGPESIGPIKKAEIDALIRDICREYFVDVEYLQAGGRKGRTHAARKKIVEKLMSDEFNLSQRKTAKMAGLSEQGVYYIARKLREKPSKDTGPPAPAPEKKTSKSKKETSNDYMILIKFADHKEIHEKLIARAADQLRTPDNQILYMLKKGFEQDFIQS